MFIAERSDFKEAWTIVPEGGFNVPYCRLENPATGRSILFVFLHTVESDGPDSEITAWVFGATPEECEKNPLLFNVTIHFIND